MTFQMIMKTSASTHRRAPLAVQQQSDGGLGKRCIVALGQETGLAVAHATSTG